MEVYTITKKTVDEILDVLESHSFSENGYSNNNDVMEAEEHLKAEIENLEE